MDAEQIKNRSVRVKWMNVFSDYGIFSHNPEDRFTPFWFLSFVVHLSWKGGRIWIKLELLSHILFFRAGVWSKTKQAVRIVTHPLKNLMICTNNLKKLNWYVLFVLTPYEDSLCSYLNQRYGADAFSVKMENYRKDKKCIEIKSAFPGYVFVCSPLPQDAFNDWLFSLEFKKGLIKQLCYKETTALRAEEIRVFEQFLDKDHLFRMSYGHLENHRLVIDQGPLKGFEDYITKYDKRNRLAVLDLFFLDQKWTAGVTLIEKDK